jgi:excisionase family DNA binding protein
MAKIPPTKAEFTFEERMLRISSLNVLTTADIAVWLNVRPDHVRSLVSARTIPHYKGANGKDVYFSKAEVEQWLLHRRIPTQEELEQEAVTYTALNSPNARARR